MGTGVAEQRCDPRYKLSSGARLKVIVEYDDNGETKTPRGHCC